MSIARVIEKGNRSDCNLMQSDCTLLHTTIALILYTDFMLPSFGMQNIFDILFKHPSIAESN